MSPVIIRALVVFFLVLGAAARKPFESLSTCADVFNGTLRCCSQEDLVSCSSERAHTAAFLLDKDDLEEHRYGQCGLLCE